MLEAYSSGLTTYLQVKPIFKIKDKEEDLAIGKTVLRYAKWKSRGSIGNLRASDSCYEVKKFKVIKK